MRAPSFSLGRPVNRRFARLPAGIPEKNTVSAARSSSQGTSMRQEIVARCGNFPAGGRKSVPRWRHEVYCLWPKVPPWERFLLLLLGPH